MSAGRTAYLVWSRWRRRRGSRRAAARARLPPATSPHSPARYCDSPVSWSARSAVRRRTRRPGPGRASAGPAGSAPGSQPVPRSDNGFDQWRRTELAPQPAERHLHHVAERIEVLVPDPVEQFLGADHSTVREQEHLEDAELLAGQQHRPAGPVYVLPRQVDHQVLPGHDRWYRRRTPAQGTYARDQFGEGERLAEVVVRAEPQPRD